MLAAACGMAGAAGGTTAHLRGGVDAHFAAANTSRDGRLTFEQARDADWPQVANHFGEIDTAGRGWITAAQIHAFFRARHRHDRPG
ncbi:MAG: EF-hand domain-containing protein [Gluconacetobacter diazotrophicus]|nr:EF-hand domain-containing protein [Gluconacetobacter diazotrophicus]